MKVGYALFLLAVIVVTVAMMVDHRNEQRIYQFCQSLAIGNPVESVTLTSEQNDVELEQGESNSLYFSQPSWLPWGRLVICEIQLADNKVSRLSFIKQ